MARIVAAALLASLLSLGAVRWLGTSGAPEDGPLADAWPHVLRAELALVDPSEAEDLGRLVALSEELYWLRRAELAQRIELGSWLRRVTRFGVADDDAERRALAFLIERVSANLGQELDLWQGKIESVGGDGTRREAVLRVLAFAKWQQKGGAFEYAYDFFQQLGRRAPTARKTATSVPPVPPTSTPSPSPRPPTRKPRATATAPAD